MQDVKKHPAFDYFTIPFKSTYESLMDLSNSSSLTIPVKVRYLQKFEKSSFSELSIVPILRKYLVNYSNKESKLKLIYNDFNELELVRR